MDFERATMVTSRALKMSHQVVGICTARSHTSIVADCASEVLENSLTETF